MDYDISDIRLDQLEYMLNSPFLKLLVRNFPLPLAIGIDDTLYMSNLSFRKLFGFGISGSLSSFDFTYFIGDIPDSILASSDYATWEIGRKCDENDVKIFCCKMLFDNKNILLAVFVPEPFSVPPDEQEPVQENLFAPDRENLLLKGENRRLENFILQWAKTFLGSSPVIMEVLRQALAIADTGVNIVITGPKGTGKTFLANLIHGIGAGQNTPFYQIDCANASLSQLEKVFSSLCEPNKSLTLASSSANLNKTNINHIDLYFENVDKLELELQIKILELMRQLQCASFSDNHVLSLRIISDANSDLIALLRSREIDNDFFKLIYGAVLHLPALNEHAEDIKLLIKNLLNYLSLPVLKNDIDPQIMKKYLAYSWPGNISELKRTISNYIFKISSYNDSLFKEEGADRNFYENFFNNNNVNNYDINELADSIKNNVKNNMTKNLPLEQFLKMVEKDFIISLLEKSGGKKEMAARLAGMGLRTFQRRCSKFNL